MADFIKYLIIDSVDEEAAPGKYLKREQILEVRDADGDPWEPVPGPDPWDEIAVTVATRWSNLNNYAVGETIYGTPASFTGGSDETAYRYRWQTKANSGDSWTNSGWTSYTSPPEVSILATAGYVRLHAQARDTVDPENVVLVNSFGPQQHILNVGSIMITGNRMSGETITCDQPTASGGSMPYTTTFSWSNGATGKTYKLQNSDVGNNITCTAKVVDGDGNEKSVTSNSMGPIVQYTLGNVNATINGVPWTQGSTAEDAAVDSDALLSIGMDGNSPNITYTWEVRNGAARLSDQGDGVNMVIFTSPGFVSIQGNALEPYASDVTGASCRFEFMVT